MSLVADYSDFITQDCQDAIKEYTCGVLYVTKHGGEDLF
jgi:hypothetical protein